MMAWRHQEASAECVNGLAFTCERAPKALQRLVGRLVGYLVRRTATASDIVIT